MTNSNPQEEQVNPKNILAKVITSPKEAFLFIDSYKYNKHATFLLILSGIIKAFDKAESKSMGDHLSIWGVIGFSIVIGVLFGWIVNYIYAFVVSKTGKYLNGKANTESILRILAYSLTPAVISIIILFIRILIYGNSIFQSDSVYSYGELNTILSYFFIFLDLFLISWSLVLFVIGISITQKFSIGKSIVNIVSPAILIMVIAFTLYFLADLFIH